MLWNARTEWSHATLQDLQWSSIDLNSTALLQSNARSRLRPERNKISFQNDAIFKSTNLKDMFKNESNKSKIVVGKASKCMHSRWKGLRHVRFRNFDLRGFRYDLIDHAKLLGLRVRHEFFRTNKLKPLRPMVRGNNLKPKGQVVP